MKSTKHLLIGAGLASNRAAKQLRDKDPDASITLVGEEPAAPYNRPPLSKEFLRGEKEEEKLLFDPKQMYIDKRIDLVLGAAVEGLDPAAKTAKVAGGEEIRFEKAFIATGGRPISLVVPGGDLEGVYSLRTLEDTKRIAAEAGPDKRAVIVGAGFIGMEIAASLTLMGVKVDVIEAESRIWSRFTDESLSGFFEGYCSERGVTFHTRERVAEIRGGGGGEGRASSVIMESGVELPCDFVCVAIGIVPNVELARDAGLEVDNGIVVNDLLQTSDPDIYAGGDVANYPDPVFGKRRRVEHWGHAGYCGTLAGQNMAGAENRYDHLTSVWSDVFDLKLLFAGDESEYDRVLVRGKYEDGSFTVFYLRGNVMRAYFGINADFKELRTFQGLIRSGQDLSGKETQLQETAFDVKELLPAM